MRRETSVVVNRPIDEVWAFLADPFNLPRVTGFLALRQTSPGPPGLGSTYRARGMILGFEVQISGAITEWDPPHTMAISVMGAGFRSGSLRLALEPAAAGTKVVRLSELEPRSTHKLLYWIAWPFIARRSRATDRNLKRLLEAGRD